LWHYKHHKPWLFAHALSVTAAHTSDRGRLYDYLHQSWPEPEPGELITEDEVAAEALTTARQAPSPQEKDEAPSGTFEAATEEEMTEETSASPIAEAEETPPAALSYIEWVKYLQQKRGPVKRPVSDKKAYQLSTATYRPFPGRIAQNQAARRPNLPTAARSHGKYQGAQVAHDRNIGRIIRQTKEI